MSMKDYDIKPVIRWKAPSYNDDPVKIITMPNIPKPLHGRAPRTVMRPSEWNMMRKRCYVNAGFKCEVCGKSLLDDPFEKQAHELYTIDYAHHISKFERCVCLCRRCHTEPGVHNGRALTMFRHHNVLMGKEKLLSGVEDIFKMVYEYNTERKPKEEEDLRVFYVLASYAENRDLHDEMVELISKYNIKFYRPFAPEEDHWQDWKMVYKGHEYPSVYKDHQDWERQMEELNRNSPTRPGREKTKAELELDAEFDKLEKELGLEKGLDFS